MGLRAVITAGFARIHWQNLVNFGIVPLTFDDPSELGRIESGDILELKDLRRQVRDTQQVIVENVTRRRSFTTRHELSGRQIEMLLAGGLINWLREHLGAAR